jgi:hypothetical protein
LLDALTAATGSLVRSQSLRQELAFRRGPELVFVLQDQEHAGLGWIEVIG